jgi:Domain of unknown function (DUF4178)
MEWLVWLIGLAIVFVIIYRISARRKATDAATPPPPAPADPFRQAEADADALRGNPRTLKPGDMVDIRGRSWAVRGSIQLHEGAWSWQEHLLDDADGVKRWLAVEEDPDLIVTLWTEVPGATVQPAQDTVDFDGRRYRLDEAGKARFSATGTTGLNPTGTMRYRDYEAADGALLSFEAYGDQHDDWEVARGEKLHRSEYTIYPQAS